MNKRMISMLLVLAMVLSFVPYVLAEEVIASGTFENGGASWTLDNNGVLTISGEGPMYGADNYYSPFDTAGLNTKIKKVIIKEGVTSIGRTAFKSCTNLTEVVIPSSVIRVDLYAFKYCSSLTKIVFPTDVTTIGEGAFFGCSALQEITLPSSVTSIGEQAFYECSSLTSINIPDGVTAIENRTFTGCTNLSNVVISSSLTTIDYNAFDGCSSLKSIQLPDSTTSIGKFAFRDCSSMTSINIPDGITTIDDYVFQSCSSLTNITIPKSVTAINQMAFYDCTSLKTIIFSGNAPFIHNGYNGYSSYSNAAFTGVTTNAYYPADNTTWTDEFLNTYYGGDITWIPYDGELPCLHPATEIRNAVTATCTVKGYTGDQICINCGKIVEKGSEIPTTGHTFGAWTQVKAPTVDDEGLEERKCTCGETEQRAIDKLPPASSDPQPTDPTPTEPVPAFTDVVPGAFYEDAVAWAVKNEITNGTSATKFSPDDNCIRAQVVTFLWRAFDCPEPESTDTGFTDVPADAYYAKAVAWAVENGITTGMGDGTFGSNEACTRAQVATFLWRAASKPAAASSTNPFTDVAPGEFYYDAVLWAVGEGITNGMSENTFAPATTCNRAQIVTFLHRYMTE